MDTKKVRGGYKARLELFEITRRTKAQAESDLLSQMDAALARCRRAPTLIDTGKGLIALVWSDPNGYCYSIVDTATAPSAAAALEARWFASYHTYGEAERAARRHLAQDLFGRDPTDDCAWVFAEPAGRSDHLGWVTWQRAYADARAQGMNDDEARAHASGLHRTT